MHVESEYSLQESVCGHLRKKDDVQRPGLYPLTCPMAWVQQKPVQCAGYSGELGTKEKRTELSTVKRGRPGDSGVERTACGELPTLLPEAMVKSWPVLWLRAMSWFMTM